MSDLNSKNNRNEVSYRFGKCVSEDCIFVVFWDRDGYRVTQYPTFLDFEGNDTVVLDVLAIWERIKAASGWSRWYKIINVNYTRKLASSRSLKRLALYGKSI